MRETYKVKDSQIKNQARKDIIKYVEDLMEKAELRGLYKLTITLMGKQERKTKILKGKNGEIYRTKKKYKSDGYYFILHQEKIPEAERIRNKGIGIKEQFDISETIPSKDEIENAI